MFRQSVRGAAAFGLAVALLFGGNAVAAAQNGHSTNNGGVYLALGDSVPFGFNPLVTTTGRANPRNFVGYPEDAAAALDLQLTNASCPGEASSGFISLSGTDNVCRPYRSAFPLHVKYSSSQLDFATRFLSAHRNAALVSLTVGANDLFVCQKQPTGCGQAELATTLVTYGQNLANILTRIRAVYDGQIVLVTYYSTNYRDPTTTGSIAALNTVTAHTAAPFGADIADGFTAFAAAAASHGGDSCAAGLLIKLPAPNTGCDIHPSATGARLLASTLAAVVDRTEHERHAA